MAIKVYIVMVEDVECEGYHPHCVKLDKEEADRVANEIGDAYVETMEAE